MTPKEFILQIDAILEQQEWGNFKVAKMMWDDLMKELEEVK